MLPDINNPVVLMPIFYHAELRLNAAQFRRALRLRILDMTKIGEDYFQFVYKGRTVGHSIIVTLGWLQIVMWIN